MVKDTIHTTKLDSTYLKGIEELKNRSYENAIKILRPYRDFNTALAYCAMDYNNSALDILKELPVNNNVKYLMAIIYKRQGKEKKAVQLYLEICQSDRSFINRGNLDPEISALIKKYGLNPNL